MKMCSVAIAILTVLSFAADASVLYNYVGPNFTLLRNTDPQSLPYDTTMHISGFIRFSEQLAPLTRYQSPSSAGVESFSFFDGIQTISSENGGHFPDFELITDEHGQFFIDTWLINAWIGDASVESEAMGIYR